jgi:mRNA interferase MazF
MVVPAYIPRKGDYIAATFDPQSGHEQKGRRPALVISNDLFNRHTGLAIVCPITNTRRDYPFHVAIAGSESVTGVVMVDQVKSIDFRARKVKKIGGASPALLDEVLSLLDACIY